ncbi:MAG: hypothetical protein QNL12_14220 [Acidimicrobiia bacterium]|nr:hypothetical protein [Acidimicrobiia bacterium]
MVPTNHSHCLANRRYGVFVTIALLLAIVTAGCAFPEEAFDGSLEGTYYVNGFDPQGVEYGGHLTITTTADPTTYEMQWIVTGSVQQGIGVVDGGQLLVEWDAIEGFDTQGTAIYEIGEEGELNGERIVAGEEGAGSEEAIPIR